MNPFLFLLTKLLPTPFYPVGLAVTLGLAAVCLSILGKNRIGLILFSAAIAVITFFSLPVVANLICKPLEMKYEQKEEYPQTAAIVLLTGGEVPPVSPRRYTEINDAGDRILHAVRLYKQNVGQKIVITGGKIPLVSLSKSSVSSLTASLVKQLFEIENEAIVLEEEAKNTAEHAKYLYKMFNEKQWPLKITLVTSALHMHRSVGVFKKKGFKVYPAPTDYRSNTSVFGSIMFFLPSAGALDLCTSAIHEYYGILAYKIMGKL